jgi:hypothetical protein
LTSARSYVKLTYECYTYGVEGLKDFNADIHETGRCVVVNGEKQCKDIFTLYIKTGSVVELGSKITI